MIASKLKTILTSAGCTRVIYESDKLANLITDQSLQTDIVGLIIQPNELILEIKANAILEHYPPFTVEILQQAARVEELAVDSGDVLYVTGNELIYNNLLVICKKVILYVIDSAEYKQIKPMTLTKILETRYDALLIGWSMPLDLTYLLNEDKDPCL